jgi:D-alanine-D-alanine ligase
MKTLAFLYNVRHSYPDPNSPITHLETDLDDQITIDSMIKHLKNLDYHILPIEANKEAYLKLYDNRKNISICYNYSVGMYGRSRYCQIPAMLEMLQLPYTGSSPLTQAIVLNKSVMQQVLKENGLPTLQSQLFTNASQKPSTKLEFPLIVKPNSQGSSAGITHSSVVYNESELLSQIRKVLQTFPNGALVQHFLTGREFSVPLLGNPPQVLPIIEPEFHKLPEGYLPFDSLEVKWVFEEQAETNHLSCPANIDSKLQNEIKTIAIGVWKALDIKDYCRIDIRQSKRTGKLYVLDVNSPAGMIPPGVSTSSYFPLSARSAGIEYEELLKTIIDSAIKRAKNT